MSKTKAHRIKQALRNSECSPRELGERLDLEKTELAGLVRDGDADTQMLTMMAPELGVDARWLKKGHVDPEAEVPEWDSEGQKVRAKRFTCGGNGSCSLTND